MRIRKNKIAKVNLKAKGYKKTHIYIGISYYFSFISRWPLEFTLKSLNSISFIKLNRNN